MTGLGLAPEIHAVFDSYDAKIERLKTALRPFADLAKKFCCDERQAREVVDAVVHACDLEAARKALEP